VDSRMGHRCCVEPHIKSDGGPCVKTWTRAPRSLPGFSRRRRRRIFPFPRPETCAIWDRAG